MHRVPLIHRSANVIEEHLTREGESAEVPSQGLSPTCLLFRWGADQFADIGQVLHHRTSSPVRPASRSNPVPHIHSGLQRYVRHSQSGRSIPHYKQCFLLRACIEEAAEIHLHRPHRIGAEHPYEASKGTLHPCRLSANSINEVSLIGSHLPNKSKRPLPTELIVNVHELFPNRLREERQTLILEHGLRDLTRLEAIEPASCVILLRMVGPGSIHVTSVSVWGHELLGGAPRDRSNPKPCSHNSCYCPTGWPCTYWLALHDRLIDHITIRYVRLTHSNGAFSQCLLESFTSKCGLHSTNNILTADSSIEHPDILSEVSIQQCWPESHCSSIHRAHASI